MAKAVEAVTVAKAVEAVTVARAVEEKEAVGGTAL